jgi:hypothetical protein
MSYSRCSAFGQPSITLKEYSGCCSDEEASDGYYAGPKWGVALATKLSEALLRLVRLIYFAVGRERTVYFGH